MARTTMDRDLVSDRTIAVVSTAMAATMAQAPAASPGSTDRPGLVSSGSCPTRGRSETAGDGSGPAGAEDHRRPEEGAGGDRGAARREDAAEARPRHQGPGQVPGGPRRHHQGDHRGDPGEPQAGAMRAPGPDPAPGPGAARLRPARAGADGRRCLIRPAPGRAAQAVRRPGESDPGDRRGGRGEIEKAASFPIPLDPKDEAAQRGGRPQAGREPGIPGGQAEGPPGGPRRRRRGDPPHRRGPDRAAARGVPQAARRAVRPVASSVGGRRGRHERIERHPDGGPGPGRRRRRRPARRPRLQHQGRPTRPTPAGRRTRASSSTRPTTTSTPRAAATSRSPS